MSTLSELRKKRTQTWEAAKAFLESKRDGSGIVSPEDTSIYEKMENEVVELGHQIEILERQRDRDEAMNQIIGVPYQGAAPGAGAAAKSGRASDEYKTAFWNAFRGRPVSNSLKEGSDPDGGYLVPDEFEQTLVEALEEQNIFRQFAHVIQTASGERKIPLVATKGEASWLEEEALIPESGDTFGQISLEAFKLGTMLKISDELLNDSVFNLESYVAKEFARRIGKKEEEAFIVGDGVKKPTGIFDSVGGGKVGITAASATALTFDEVIDLYHSLKQPYRSSAVFLTNDSTIKTLRKLKSSDGQYLWQPSVKDGAPDTILGKPVYTSQFVPEIAAGAIAMAFGDFSYYWIGDRQSRTFKRLDQLFAVTDQVGFKATQRVDGKLILPEAVQILKMGS
jgi:HK97 family phage major capsid protein